MSKTLFGLVIIFILSSCNVKYRQLKTVIADLPPKKLLPGNYNANSGVTSKIDSLTTFSLTTDQKLSIVLDLIPPSLKQDFNEYKRHRSNDNFDNVVRHLNKISVEKDIYIKVKIKTFKPGAVVKYHAQAINDETTANNPTNDCYVNFNIGYYFIWTERDDKKTAIPKRYFIAVPDSITVAEKIKR